MELSCAKCIGKITTKEYLKCVLCKQTYHLQCTSNVGEKRFYLMTPEDRIKWKCQLCCNNITTRTKYQVNVPTNNSFETLSDSDSDTEDLDFTSVPSSPTSIDFQSRIEAQNKIISSLQKRLVVYEDKIIDLISKNRELNLALFNCENKDGIQTTQQQNKPESSSAPPRDQKQNKDPLSKPVTFRLSEQTIKGPKKSLDGARSTDQTNLWTSSVSKLKENNKYLKAKICMLSANKHNTMLSTAERYFCENFELCHYLNPDVGIKDLLKNAETKLEDFTMNDFCMLFIGERDFKTTQNYVELVLYLRKVIQKLNHTNIVICFPTYNCGRYSSLFNWRVETFNNLLYLDIVTHEHAYLLDCNLNLTYDYSNFSRHSGRVNNQGMNTIFQDLATMMTFIQDEHTTNLSSASVQFQDVPEIGNEQQDPNQLFRV